MARYPKLSLDLSQKGRVLDLGFGDGRNTIFLCEQGYHVYGVEISKEIVALVNERIEELGLSANLKVGDNTNIPFDKDFFDVILACHVSYYCKENESFQDNVKEIARTLKPGGYFITSLADRNSYLFKDSADAEGPGHVIVKKDPYNNRNNCKFRVFATTEEIKSELQEKFCNFSFGKAHNNYFGIDEKVFWVVCQKNKMI